MGEDLVPIIQPDAKHGSRQDRGDGSFNLDWFFRRQKVLFVSGSAGGKRTVAADCKENREPVLRIIPG
jgi:hypothetical protein